MKLSLGELVRIEGYDEDKYGVVVSGPIQTPLGYTVRVATKNKVITTYAWNLKPMGSNKQVELTT